MKKILFLIAVLICGIASAQPSGYMKQFINNGVNRFFADSTFHVPSGGAAALRGSWTRAGAIFYDSTGADSGFYVRGTGNTFQRLARASEAAGSIIGTANRITVSSLTVDISNAYVGQGTITTLGTVTTGTWGSGAIIGDATMNLTGTDATGDMYYRNSSGILTRLPVGTVAQTLHGGTIPIWKDTAVGGGGGGPSGVDFVQNTRSKDGAEIVGANIQTYPSGYNTPGIITSKERRLFNSKPEAISYSSISNTGAWYDAFSSGTSYNSTIWVAFKRATGHVANGWLPVYRSEDGGQTFDSVNVLSANGNDVNITAIGDTVFYNHTSGITGNILIGYTTDGFTTKVLTDSVDQGGTSDYPYGKFIKKPSGKIAFLTYGLDATNYYIRIVESTDNGVSWDWHSLITSGTLAAPINLNEGDWEIVNEPTSDADCKIIAVFRDEFLNGPQQWTSSDGYATWGLVGTIDQLKSTDDEYGFPTLIKKFGKDIYLCAGRRTNMPGVSTAPYFHIASMRGSLGSVFTNTALWSTPNILLQSEYTYRGVGDYFDFGYTGIFEYNNVLMTTFYDVSPYTIEGGTVYTRIGIMPILGIWGVDLYSGTNQSIPDATETLVSTPIVRYDTENAYNSGSGLVEIVRDGWYDLAAVCTFAASTDGTYRTAYIKVIDIGKVAVNRIISEVMIQPTIAPEFLRLELRANSIFLRSGERVGFYVKHNGGSGEELNNQGDIKYRAKLSLKKQRK